MAKLNMDGPFVFDSEQIDESVTRTSPGNYALGYMRENNGSTFIVKYVGRSDTDLNAELKQYLSQPYVYFKFSYATSPKKAFEKECTNYHDFGGSDSLDNKIHPRRPDGTGWKCPMSGCDAL